MVLDNLLGRPEYLQDMFLFIHGVVVMVLSA